MEIEELKTTYRNISNAVSALKERHEELLALSKGVLAQLCDARQFSRLENDTSAEYLADHALSKIRGEIAKQTLETP